MAVATGLVAVMPVLVVWSLRSAGLVPWPWLGLVAAMGLSTIVSAAGCAYWKRREGSGDLLFSELLVWGWLRRWHAERQLADAVRLLAPLNRNGDWRPQRPAGRHEQLLRRVAGALEAEDRYTRGHSARVARYATSIARKMGLPRREIETIRAAAMVHDVGKLRVPLEVLNKPTRLTDAEFALIRRHPVDGAEMVAALQHDDLTAIVRHHHERLDGRGYPDGLAGDEIPIGARIIAVADTFDAITSLRPYRPRRDHKTALDILTREQGTQLDRDAVRAFLICYSGRRSVAVWSVMTSVFERLAFSLTGQARAATITTGSAAATAVATAAIGAVAMVSPTVAHPHPVSSRQAVRASTGSPAGSTFATTLVATLLGSAPARPLTPGTGLGAHGSRARAAVAARRHHRAKRTRPRVKPVLPAAGSTATQITPVAGVRSRGNGGGGGGGQHARGSQLTGGGHGSGVGRVPAGGSGQSSTRRAGGGHGKTGGGGSSGHIGSGHVGSGHGAGNRQGSAGAPAAGGAASKSIAAHGGR